MYIVHLTINQWAHHLLLHSDPETNDLRGVGVMVLALYYHVGGSGDVVEVSGESRDSARPSVCVLRHRR